MTLFISKGVPYNNDNKSGFKVWVNGNIISLTHTQQLIWTYLLNNTRSYNDLLKYSLNLIKQKIPIPKTELNRTLKQLKQLDLISYIDEQDTKLGEFILVFKNKIKPLKEINLSDFEKRLFDFISDDNEMSIADFIASIDNLEYNKLTNGYDVDYIKFVYQGIHSKMVLTTTLQLLQKGACYIS